MASPAWAPSPLLGKPGDAAAVPHVGSLFTGVASEDAAANSSPSSSMLLVDAAVPLDEREVEHLLPHGAPTITPKQLLHDLAKVPKDLLGSVKVPSMFGMLCSPSKAQRAGTNENR